MKFKVIRTSDFWEENTIVPPCEGATLEEYDYIERCRCTEEEYNNTPSFIGGFSSKWKTKGINHTTWEKGIQRTFPNDRKGWFIELNSLEDLINFKNKVKEDIIIKECYSNYLLYEIEIYDDWE